MIDRSHTEKILRLNGLDPNAPPDEIRTVLVRARWHKDDVEAALAALNRPPDDVSVDYTHPRAMHSSDTRLAPETLNAVLGIDVELTHLKKRSTSDENWFIRRQIVSLLLVAVLGAALFVVTIMWQLKLGMFAELF